MPTNKMSPEELRQAGIKAFVRELGASGMARFLVQFGVGRGDYSTERHESFANWDMEKILEKIRERRTAK